VERRGDAHHRRSGGHDAAQDVRRRRRRPPRPDLSRRQARLRSAVAGRDPGPPRGAARALSRRHQALREPAQLSGRPGADAVRPQDAPHSRGARIGRMSEPVILSIEAYDYFAAEMASRCGVAPGDVERSTFPDGERHLRVRSEVNDRDVVVIGGTVSDAATLELYDLANAVVENGAATLTLVVPW